MIFVCHGFGCKYRVELDLTPSDRAKLAQLLTAGKSTAEAEGPLRQRAPGLTGALDRLPGRSIMWRAPE